MLTEHIIPRQMWRKEKGRRSLNHSTRDTRMNFLDAAHKSYKRITCKTIRSILYECAAESLCQIVKSRSQQLQNEEVVIEQEDHADDAAEGGTLLPPPQRQIQITQNDIDTAYELTHKIGRKWAEKLILTDDDCNGDIAKIVELVLENGHFLDTCYQDDLMNLNLDRRTRGRSSTRRMQERNDGEDSASVRSSDDDEIPIAAAESTRPPPPPQEQQQQQTSAAQINNPNNMHMKQSIPYTSLLKIGQIDPCNLNQKETVASGTASAWKPLPAALPSSSLSLVHIPNPTILSQDQLQSNSNASNSNDSYLLYGQPGMSMPKPMNVREQIDSIDEMAYDDDDNHHHTMWPHGWDIIQEQAEKNRERMNPQKLSGKGGLNDHDGEKEVMEVIPRSLLDNELVTGGDANGDGDANGTGRGGGRDSNVNDNDGPVFVEAGADGDVQRVSATRAFQKTSTLRKMIPRRRRDDNDADADDRNGGGGEEENTANNTARETEQIAIVGKQPSAYSDVQWTSQEIKDDLGESARESLEKTMLHNDEETEKEYHSCQGALKMVGNIHLWEQIRAKQWKGIMDDIPAGDESEAHDIVDKRVLKMRKSVHRKAKRQRLYPNFEPGTKASGHVSKLTSKIVRAGEGQEGVLTSSIGDADGFGKQCIELDLGECTVALLVPAKGDDSSNDIPRERKVLAFRSLEISLSE